MRHQLGDTRKTSGHYNPPTEKAKEVHIVPRRHPHDLSFFGGDRGFKTRRARCAGHLGPPGTSLLSVPPPPGRAAPGSPRCRAAPVPAEGSIPPAVPGPGGARGRGVWEQERSKLFCRRRA